MASSDKLIAPASAFHTTAITCACSPLFIQPEFLCERTFWRTWLPSMPWVSGKWCIYHHSAVMVIVTCDSLPEEFPGILKTFSQEILHAINMEKSCGRQNSSKAFESSLCIRFIGFSVPGDMNVRICDNVCKTRLRTHVTRTGFSSSDIYGFAAKYFAQLAAKMAAENASVLTKVFSKWT